MSTVYKTLLMKVYGNKTHHVAVIDSATFMLKLFGVRCVDLLFPSIYEGLYGFVIGLVMSVR